MTVGQTSSRWSLIKRLISDDFFSFFNGIWTMSEINLEDDDDDDDDLG